MEKKSSVTLDQPTKERMIRRIEAVSMATMFVFAATANILPVSLVRISRDIGFSLTQAGFISFAGSWLQFGILITSGILASFFGKLKLIRFALLAVALGLGSIAQSGTYLLILTFSLVMALGHGILEALLTPLVEDLHPGDHGTHMNLLHAFWPMGVLVCVLGAGELLSRGVSWRIVYIGLGVITLAILLLQPSGKGISFPSSRRDLAHFKEILRLPHFWLSGLAMFFAGGAEAGFAFWSASYIQLEFDTLPRAGAFGAASFALGMAVGRILSSRISSRIGLRQLLEGAALLGVLVGGTFFLIDTLPLLYAFMLVIGVIIAPLWPSIQSYAAKRNRVDPTMLMVLLSCFGVTGYSSATLIMGFLGDLQGIRISFVVIPIYLLSLFFVIFLAGTKRAHSGAGSRAG
ncbi:MAG: MFS transporter [Spirochaetaceae bacterium]